jgi:hypothetical protein
MKCLDELLLYPLAPTGRPLGTLRRKLLTRRSLVLLDDPVSKPIHDWILLPVRGSDSEICQPQVTATRLARCMIEAPFLLNPNASFGSVRGYVVGFIRGHQVK